MIRTPHPPATPARALGGTLAVLAATALAAAVPVPSAGATTHLAPVPDGPVTIELLSVDGSGCRPGSAAVAVAPDRTAFTVTYSEYLAQVGKDAGPADFRRDCRLSLRVHGPQGFTYAVSRADYRGFADLRKGARGTQTAGYSFDGTGKAPSRSHTFHGPVVDAWQTTDAPPVGAVVHVPCGEQRNFTIDTELLVDGGTSDTAATTSFLSMDSTDGSTSTRYHFSWRKCPAR
ncbi:DUF4360 domain-containing protein [Streptomyces sp. NPDC048349]|uniref:DUF4360 domain-containing protein n=1 Tax=Streptomyces sp. NPDC048349 TaxID=3155486 RepID=UPI00342EED58